MGDIVLGALRAPSIVGNERVGVETVDKGLVYTSLQSKNTKRIALIG